MLMTQQIKDKAIADLTLHLAVLKDYLTQKAALVPRTITKEANNQHVIKLVRDIQLTENAIKYFNEIEIQTPKPTQQ